MDKEYVRDEIECMDEDVLLSINYTLKIIQQLRQVTELEQLVYRTKVTNLRDVVYGIGAFLSCIPEVTIVARGDKLVKYKFKDTSTN